MGEAILSQHVIALTKLKGCQEENARAGEYGFMFARVSL